MNRREIFRALLGISCAPVAMALPTSAPKCSFDMTAIDSAAFSRALGHPAMRTALRNAAKVFSETYASPIYLSQEWREASRRIRYVGWSLPPDEAAAAFAVVTYYEGMASLDVGTYP
jgi:hypothetical protein